MLKYVQYTVNAKPKSREAEILRKGSPPHVTCQLSHVKCQVTFFIYTFFLQIVGVSHERAYYQQGLPHLVLLWPSMLLSNHVKLYIAQYGVG